MKRNILSNSVVLITGGTGSWGQELTYQLLKKYNPREIRIFSRGEHAQVMMKRIFRDKRIRYIIGDVRDKYALLSATRGVNLLFHLAALKHVPVCEENPWEAVKTNIIGAQNVIDAAIANGVSKTVDISTDKAVDPFNLYGMTKACGEKLMIAANLVETDSKFVCIRGGNVIGTKGSVVPLFKEQLAKFNEITITDKRMTRFFMRLEEIIQLILKTTLQSVGGEVFVIKMPSCRITDLAKVMAQKLGSKATGFRFIGIRPGEKVHEVLISRYETERVLDAGKYFVILPSINVTRTKEYYVSKKLKRSRLEEYSSNSTELLSEDEISLMLEKDRWFEKDLYRDSSYDLRNIPEKSLKNIYKSEGWTK